MSECTLSIASREASFRVTFVVVVVVVAVSVCDSSSLLHFLQKLAQGMVAAEIEIVVCRLRAQMKVMGRVVSASG